ncbi:hypothetical protein [Paenibacillus sp. N3.4]|nr:hypothetical protein [Paenibacillus sp. N3.4]
MVHGFEIPGANVNMMIVPDEISHVSSHTFYDTVKDLIVNSTMGSKAL